MKRREPDTNTMNITGGTFIGSTAGVGKVDNHAKVEIDSVSVGAAERSSTVADLRAMLVAARQQILDASADAEERTELGYELRKILEELETETPDPAPVRSRWTQIQRVLGPVATASSSIATITELIGELFRSS